MPRGAATAPAPEATAKIIIGAGDSTAVGVQEREGGDTAFAGTSNWRTRAPAGISTSLPYDQAIAPDGTSYLSHWEYSAKRYTELFPTKSILVVPHGWNGSSIAGESPQWGVGNSLHESAIARANAAIAAYLAANPDAVLEFEISVSEGTNDQPVDADEWETAWLAAIADIRSRVFKNGVSGATIGTDAVAVFRGMLPENMASGGGASGVIEHTMRKFQYTMPNARYWKQAEGNSADGVHPTNEGQRLDGVGLENTVYDTTPPVFSAPASFSIYSGEKLAREIVTDKPAWYYLTGTDAALFEIVPLAPISTGGAIDSQRFSWYLRWASDGVAPAADTYNVTINAKGSAASAATQALVVTVGAAYGTQVEAIASSWEIGQGADTSPKASTTTFRDMPLKRGVNVLATLKVAGGVTDWTACVCSNGLVGVRDANSGEGGQFYIYSAQDETVDIDVTWAGDTPSVFAFLTNLKGTTALPASSATTTSATVNMTCPASGIVIVQGYAVGGLTPPSGQTNYPDPPIKNDGAMYAGYRTTTGDVGAGGGFARLFASAWAKAA
jgi:hypothetical protein